MPFDFDVAMDVLENLTPDERVAVLRGLGAMLGPTTHKDAEKVYVLWAKHAYGMKLEIDASELIIPGRLRAGVGRRIATVEFKCDANDLHGVMFSHDAGGPAPKNKQERDTAKLFAELQKRNLNRKERDLL